MFLVPYSNFLVFRGSFLVFLKNMHEDLKVGVTVLLRLHTRRKKNR